MEKVRKGFLNVEVEVKAYDRNGKVIAVRKKESDLILTNFIKLVSTILSPLAYENRTANLVAPDGVARVHTVIGDVGTDLFNFRKGATNLGVEIAIGTSTVAPTRDDYKLGAEVARGTPTWTLGADYLKLAVSIVLEVAKTIAEAGVVMRLYSSGAGYVVYAFFFRDTFTPIDVPAGGTISVTYTITY